MVAIYLIIYSTFPLVLCDLSLLILHTNDMHARYEQVDRNMGKCKGNEKEFCYGGFARLHAMVTHFKTEATSVGRSTLFVNAGDTFSGTPYYTQFKWELAAKMINTLDIDVMTLGNHEFDGGIKSLASYIDKVNVPVVCSNLDLSNESSLQTPKLTSSKILLVNGTRVGIIGYLTTTTVQNHNLAGVRIMDEMTSVRKEVSKLKDKGVEIIIALSHSGYDKDLEIAKEVEEIDVIVGGHTHTFLYSGEKRPELEEPSGPYPTVVTQESGKQVPVVQAYFGTKYLGYLELNFNNNGELKSFKGSPILLIGLFPQDPDVLRELEPYKEKLNEKTNKIIGFTHVFLDSNNFKCKISECELGNLITDAFTDYMVMGCPSVPISVGLMNAGGIRSSLDPISGGNNGSITLEDVMTVLPWGKPIVALNLSGKVLLQVLEHAVSRFDDIKTSHVNTFLQVSGIRVTYDLARKVGQQVTHVKVLCNDCTVPWFKPLKLEETYGVVVPEHLARGGEDLSMLTDFKKECVSEEVDYAIVAKYIEIHSPVNPRIEGRIQITQGEIDDQLILPMICYIMIVILVVFIFKETLFTPVYKLFSRTNQEQTIPTNPTQKHVYSRLVSSEK